MRKASFALVVMAWLMACFWMVKFTLETFREITGSDVIAIPIASVLALMLLLVGWPRRKMPDGRQFGFGRFVALLISGGIVVGTFMALEARDQVVATLTADRTALLAYNPPVTTRVYAADGSQVCEFTLENRIRMPLAKIPLHVQNAFIAAEDKNFREHHGIDPIGIMRAAEANWVAGATKQGASTLTQQVIKQLVLKNNAKTMQRKIQEAILAVEIERKLSKDQVLETYLNHVFLGRGAYGVEAAARTYFGKGVGGLTLSEAAILAGLPKAPSADSPVAHFARAASRRDYVLGRMVEDGYALPEDAAKAKGEPAKLVIQDDPFNRSAAPYFCDLTRRELKRLYGNDVLFNEGLTVETTLDMRMQRAAEAAVRSGLLDLERRIGWSGPDGHDDTYVGCRRERDVTDVPDGRVESARVASVSGSGYSVCLRGRLVPVHPDDVGRMRDWERKTGTRLRVGDTASMMVRTEATTGNRSKLTRTGRVLKRAEEVPGAVTRYAVTASRIAGSEHPEALQAALVAVEPASGELKAYVGGYDFGENQFNTPIMARRQPGSSIKVVVYVTGLMDGMTVEEKVVDARRCYSTSSGQWCPENYRGPDTRKQYFGEVRLDKALAESLNSVSVQIEVRVGLDAVISTMRKLGYESPVQRVLALAVGSVDVTLWEHTYAYAQLAANGAKAPSHPWPETGRETQDGTQSVVDPESVASQRRVGVFFRRVMDRRGDVLLNIPRTEPDERGQAIPSADAYSMLHLMKGVVQDGTGKRALELGRPIAAKTGTTNDFRDVWFMGCTADLCAGTWVGRMTPKPIVAEATGGAVALPIWLAFMKAGHPDVPARDFPIPDDVVMMPSMTGGLAPFQRGHVPQKLLVSGP